MRRILLALVSGIVLGVTACDSGSGATLGEYLAKMDSLRTRLEEDQMVQRIELEAIHEEGDPFSEEERAKHDRDRIVFLIRVVRETGFEVEKVQPAAEAEEAHDAYITAIEGLAAAAEATLADDTYEQLFSPPDPRLTPAQKDDSIMTFSALPALIEAESDLANACGELRGIAFSNYEKHPEDGILERPC